jgi:hypothetical protein
MLVLIALWYENREEASVVKLENIPYGVNALIANYRMWARD